MIPFVFAKILLSCFLFVEDPLEPGLLQWLHNLSSLDAGVADPVADFPLKKEQVGMVRQKLWEEWTERMKEEYRTAIQAKEISITNGDQSQITLKWLERRFGPEDGSKKPLFISMHGGGGAPARVNDQQWNNQIRLYEPAEGIVVAPRAPGNTWDLWHQAPIDKLFDQLISTYVVAENVDPNRIYLMGYSAGGDGVYQVAPRMADRFAAAAMMAGHPNESQPLGLRNLPFALFVGEKDGAYNRNQVAMDWGKKLDDLQKEDPQGYLHWMKLNPGKPHWMGGEDRESLPWMLRYQRITHPNRIVWYQDDVVHSSFYWLQYANSQDAKGGAKIVAEANGNKISLTTEEKVPIQCWLPEELFNLEEPVEVIYNGESVYKQKPVRTVALMLRSLLNHRDPNRIYSAMIEVKPMAKPTEAKSE